MLYLVLTSALLGASIHGTVRAEGSRAPLPNASVTIVALAQTRTTDSAGGFTFADVPAGQWRLTLAAPGFEPYETIVRVSDGGSVRLDIELGPMARPLPRVKVEASKPSDADTVRALFRREPLPAVTSLSGREMRAMIAPIEPDVLESLQSLPGVVPVNDFDAQLYVRGGAGDQNLFLLDGARVFGPHHMFGMTGAFNPDAVDRATFFRGSMPPRFGGSLSSVVELEQRDGAAGDSVQAGLSLLAARAAVGGTMFGDRARWMLAGRRSHADLLLRSTMPYAFHDLQGRLSLSISPRQQISASLFTSSDRFRMFLANDGESLTSHWTNTVGSLRWRQVGDDGSQTLATAWVSRFNGRMTAGDELRGPTTHDDVFAGGLRAERLWEGERSRLRVGTELDLGRITLSGTDLPGSYFSGLERRSYLTPSVYAEGEYRLGAVGLFPGLRLTRDTRSGRPLAEPRLSARLYLPDSITLTLAATRGHQSISMLRDERTVLPGPPFWFVHPREAPTSRSDNLSAELHVPLSATWTVTAEAYRRRFRGLPHWRPEGGRDLTSISYDAGTSTGLEISVRRHGERVSGWVGYGLGRIRLTDASSGDSYAPSWDRRRSFTAALMANIASRLGVSARVDYGSGQPFWPFAGEVGTPRFSALTGGVDLTELTTFWGGEQLRGASYFRADVGLRTAFAVRGVIIEPYLSIQNLTSRPNVLGYKLRRADPPEYGTGAGTSPTASLTPIAMPGSLIPTFGFNVRF